MKVVDLHPEELFDKEARGTLTETERTRFEAHLAQCVACRLERQLRLDFASELGDDEEEAISERLFVAPLAKERAPEPKTTPETTLEEAPEDEKPVPMPLPLPQRPRLAVWLVAAAALLAASAAAANEAGGGAWLRRVVGLEASATEHERATNAPPPHVAPIACAPVPAAPALDGPAAPTSVEEAPPPTPPAVIVPVSVPAAPASAVLAVNGAARLFDEANEARRRGDYARAIELHRELQARHGSTREAQVSRATLGRLLLDRGDAISALASFEDYRAHRASGQQALDEEVLAGRATALERLGRAEQARAAWQTLLDEFPASPHAKHARHMTGASESP